MEKNCRQEEQAGRKSSKEYETKLLSYPANPGGNSVFVVNNGQVEIREVQTGAKNLTQVEILKGLEKGEQVITRTPHLFRAGQSVKSALVDSIVK